MRLPVRTLVGTATTILGVGALALSPTAGLASGGLPHTGKSVPRFAPVYMGWAEHGHGPSQAQAVTVARNFDVIAANGQLAPYAAAMHAANRNLVLVDYVNALYSPPKAKYPETWYSHDSKGHRIKTHQFGNYLMNPASAGWRATVDRNCKADVARSHYDGCFLDNLGQGPFAGGYTTGTPVNPVTHRVWDRSAWMNATSGLAQEVQTTNPSLSMVANGLVNGQRFFGGEGTHPLAGHVDGAMSELWLRQSEQPATQFVSVPDWKADVDMLVDAERAGESVLTTVKLWRGGTPAQVDQVHKYALASFLLGSSGRSFFSFSASQTWAGLTATAPYDNLSLGAPQGAYQASGNVYQRRFAQGIVAVVPGGAPARLSLPAGSWTTLEGRTVSGSITLGAHTGEVLRHKG